MIDIQLDISPYLHELDNVINGLQNAVDDALVECAQLLMQEESDRTKGVMSKSFYTYKEGDEQMVDNSKEYAQYIENGRGPVRAINAKALRFVINGEVIFRKSVGPMKAQPFMKASIRASQSKFSGIFEKHINQLTKR